MSKITFKNELQMLSFSKYCYFLCLFNIFIRFKLYYISHFVFGFYFLKMLAWWLWIYWQFTPWNAQRACISTFHTSFLWPKKKDVSPVKYQCLHMYSEAHSYLTFQRLHFDFSSVSSIFNDYFLGYSNYEKYNTRRPSVVQSFIQLLLYLSVHLIRPNHHLFQICAFCL